MATVNDILRLVVGFGGTVGTWYNRFYYQIATVNDATADSADALTEAWLQDVWPKLEDVMSIYVGLVTSECQNLDLLTDFNSSIYNPATYAGDVASEALPPWWTITYKCARPYPPLRNGYKKFGGIAEAVVSYDHIETAYITASNALATALGSDIQSGAVPYVFRPVIVPGEYANGTTPPPWVADDWAFAVVGTQRTRMA